MEDFCLTYKDITLHINCEKDLKSLIVNMVGKHFKVTNYDGQKSYSLVIRDSINIKPKGITAKLSDKWFNNAKMKCTINNNDNVCYIYDFEADTLQNKTNLLIYFVINIFNRLLELKGFFAIHSSCVSKDNEGIAFVAPRNSGKTCSVLNLMNNGYDFVTNDKLAIKGEDEYIEGVGIPQSISIRLSPEFCSLKENQKYIDFAKKRNIQLLNNNQIDGDSLLLSEIELLKLNSAKAIQNTNIKHIIRPFYDCKQSEAKFIPMTDEDISFLIEDQSIPLVHETKSFLKNLFVDYGIDLELTRKLTIEQLYLLRNYFCLQNEKTNMDFIQKIKKL